MTGSSLYDQMHRRRRRRRGTAIAVMLVLAVGGAGAWWLLRPVPQDPRIAAAALAEDWSRGDIAGATFTSDAPSDVGEQYAAIVEGLRAEPPDVVVASVDDPAADDDPLTAEAQLELTWQLEGDRTWSYATTLSMVRAPDQLEWGVVWSPSLVHPTLAPDRRLVLRRTTADRGDVLAVDGTPLVTDWEVVDVGIEPQRVEDLPPLVETLTTVLADRLDVQLDAADLTARVEQAAADAFVSVLTLREDDYLRVQDAVQPLPGTVFSRRTTPLAPTRDFARFTLGSAGPVTAEMIEQQPDRYVAGDVAGRSGLQAAHDERLFGEPGAVVVATGADADPEVLFEDAAVPGEPITVTLDARVQVAAEAAIEGTGFPAGVAVVRPSDGHVLALANSSEAGFDLARAAQVPPGSTFKLVTTSALLAETELAATTPVDCPNAITVGGRTITNAETQELGTVPFRTAFVNSCNTAFVQLSQQLTSTSLQQAAARFGLGRELALGIDGFGGQVPETGDVVDLAASAIGQGRNLVSPLAMAGAVATVANGQWPGLSLVVDPAPDAPTPPEPLPDGQAALLQELTRGVVTDGTATSLADVPGGPVHGKTGTAEFAGEDGDLRTHAWFVGYQGDLAFAVVVTDTPGAYGGEVAAPVAERLLTALAR